MLVTDYLRHHILYLDGAMGTLLQSRGLRPGEAPERWNLTHAAEVAAAHRAYFEAGSNAVLANTFGANPLRYDADELAAIVAAALANAHQARASSGGGQAKFVALDLGPTGRMLRPFGDLDFEDAVRAFAALVRLGAAHGADFIFIETMSDGYETKAALLAARENSDLPVFVSNAYGADGRLLSGTPPEAMAALLEGLHADAIGANCSAGPEGLAGVIDALLLRASVPVIFKPNAGLPRSEDGRAVYDMGPEAFAAAVAPLVARGVRVVGGCCGTTPAHIAALVRRTAGMEPPPIRPKALCCTASYARAVTFGGAPVLIGERINPTGKKRFQQALRERDIGYLLREGVAEQASGAHVLDVNVGLPGVDEAALLRDAVCELQAVTELPLQIDTADPAAMEAALRRCNGKPMLNSVNGREESLRAVLPLARKYGALVTALTLDEHGIPDTAQGRVRIAERILHAAAGYGLGAHELVFDPLTMAVSAEAGAARETLRAVRLIGESLGCHTLLGVSNVSFGLPQRSALNAAFLLAALENGLSAAIVNPHDPAIHAAVRAYCALHGLDEGCRAYIDFAAAQPQAAPAAAPAPQAEQAAIAPDGLRAAVEQGLREQAGALAGRLLEDGEEPLALIEREIIPALDAVGRGFEQKRVYLPQLLMSAEAAGSAFERVRAAMAARPAAAQRRCPVVLATVEGDIHDIGKNIARLLLENYGFSVTDLGRDVPPARVAEAVVRLHAPLLGLSALMTTTVPAMERTIRQVRAAAPWCRIMAGGAVLTADEARRIGADCYVPDAMASVRYAERVERALP